MKIVVLKGRSNRHSSSNPLAEEFMRGEKELRLTFDVIDAIHADLYPCTNCVVHCRYEGPCV